MVGARTTGARFLGYVVDSLGVAAVLEPRELMYTGRQVIPFQGEAVPVPESLSWTAVQGADSLTARIALQKVALSRLTLGADQDVYFAQMQGTLTLRGSLGGSTVDASGPGFFETYLRRAGTGPETPSY